MEFVRCKYFRCNKIHIYNELIWDEVSEAHKTFVTSWMSGVIVNDFDVDENTAADVAN